jgi:hypothetical protein
VDSRKVFRFGEFEEEFVGTKDSKRKWNSKFPSFGKSCQNRLVVMSFVRDDMSNQR